MYHHIANLKKLGFNPDPVVDVGALFGQWTENVIAIFPEATFIMIEPQADKRKYLDAIAHKFKNVNAEFSLVGDIEKDEVEFYEMGSG